MICAISMMEIDDGKYMFGTVKVGSRGQIVIPSEAREMFDIKPGDMLVVLGDRERGLAVVRASMMRDFALKALIILDEMKNILKGG